MNFRRLPVLLLAGMWSAAYAAFDIGTLMHELARHPGGRARFVETRTMAVLDKPVVFTGELLFQPPGRLEKRTLEPTPETVLLDGDTLTMERDKRRLTISVSSRPEAQAFVESIRSTLSGDRRALEKYYRLELSGAPADWSLTLRPMDSAVAAFVHRITVSGGGNQVRRIEYLQADGDRSELAIDPIVVE